MTIGRHRLTGRVKRAFFYAKARKEVANSWQVPCVIEPVTALGHLMNGHLANGSKHGCGSTRNLGSGPSPSTVMRCKSACVSSHNLGTYRYRTSGPTIFGGFTYNDIVTGEAALCTFRYCHTIVYGALAQAERH
jgi:hypothetical protein